MAGALPLQNWLSQNGTRFDRAYTVLPICSPSRASMLTGLYPHNHGLTENDGRFGGRAELDANDTLFTTSFQDAGYRCGWFGKWHLSQDARASDFGFEGWSLPDYGYPYANAAYADYLRRKGLPDPKVRIELPGESQTPGGTTIDLKSQQAWFDYEAGTALLDAPAETHEAYFVADMAAEWLQALDPEEAFFLRVDPWGPHPPYTVPSDWEAHAHGETDPVSPNLSFDLENRPNHHRDYRDYWRDALPKGAADHALLCRRALQHAHLVETALAGLLPVLDELGRLEETIIVFSPDHGDAVGSNGGALNKGGLMTEETMRIPMVMAGPGIPAGAICTTPVANIDIAPTVSELAHVNIPEGDGESLLPLLHGKTLRRPGVMAEHYGLHVHVPQRAWYEGDWKLVLQADGFAELYNLAEDSAEMKNLSDTSEHKPRLSDMHANLLAEMDRTRDTDPRLNAIRTFKP